MVEAGRWTQKPRRRGLSTDSQMARCLRSRKSSRHRQPLQAFSPPKHRKHPTHLSTPMSVPAQAAHCYCYANGNSLTPRLATSLVSRVSLHAHVREVHIALNVLKRTHSLFICRWEGCDRLSVNPVRVPFGVRRGLYRHADQEHTGARG